MCSPKKRLSSEEIVETKKFEGIILENGIDKSSLPAFSKPSDIRKYFNFLKQTEFKNVWLVSCGGKQVYLVDMWKTFKTIDIGSSCYKLAKKFDLELLKAGKKQVNNTWKSLGKKKK